MSTDSPIDHMLHERLPSWLHQADDGWLITVRVQPSGKMNQLLHLDQQQLRIRIKAPPIEGKANEVLIAWFAEIFKLKRRDVMLISGQTSRDKRLKLLCTFDAQTLIACLNVLYLPQS